MKNAQKGFVVPLLITIIVMLTIGSGVYFYKTEEDRDNYSRIPPAQTDQQAISFLQQMQTQIGTNYEMMPWKGFQNFSGYKVNLPGDKFVQAGNYLASKIGKDSSARGASELGYLYENWHLICIDVGLRAGSSPPDLPYIWCADKVGVQKVIVTVGDIKNIDIDTRTFTLTLGTETMNVKMPAVVQNTSYENSTFADFVKDITDVRYQTSTFEMSGELKGNVFEVTDIKWILG